MESIAIRQARVDDIHQLCLLNGEVQAIHVHLFPDVFKHTEWSEIENWFQETLNDDLIIILVRRAPSFFLIFPTI